MTVLRLSIGEFFKPFDSTCMVDGGIMGPCLTVIAYNHVTGQGLASHLGTINMISGYLETVLVRSVAKLGDPLQTELIIVGLGPIHPEDEIISRLREDVYSTLKDFNVRASRVVVRFLPAETYAALIYRGSDGTLALDIYREKGVGLLPTRYSLLSLPVVTTRWPECFELYLGPL